MKKLTAKSRKWHRIHVHGLKKRRSLDHNIRRKKRYIVPTKTITLPEDFSLKTNFVDVVTALNNIRQQSKQRIRGRFYIDFKKIQTLSPAAALVLAAELDRWNHVLGYGRMKAVDVHKWDDHIRNLLGDMGFFSLLKIQRSHRERKESANIRYMKFRTGNQADGEAFDQLLQEIISLWSGEIAHQKLLYAAVTEAMTNVVHHAYEEGYSSRKNWWLSASYDTDRHEVRFMLYDQGIGIPKTVPKKFQDYMNKGMLKGNMLEIFNKAMESVRKDADLIKLAHNLHKSVTKEKHRGFGLGRDVRGYLKESAVDGEYNVISLKGVYTVIQENKKQKESLRTYGVPLDGTLIEWRLS